jgi:hypothetical protein
MGLFGSAAIVISCLKKFQARIHQGAPASGQCRRIAEKVERSLPARGEKRCA